MKFIFRKNKQEENNVATDARFLASPIIAEGNIRASVAKNYLRTERAAADFISLSYQSGELPVVSSFSIGK